MYNGGAGNFTIESKTLADNATQQLQREVLMNIKGMCMMESSTLASNVVNNSLREKVLLNIKW